MTVTDLKPEQHAAYFQCLEDWSDEIKEAGEHKENWFNFMKERGLRVKIAIDDAGTPGGMIQYAPIEHSYSALAQRSGLYFIYCIWVHGHTKGRGNFQKKGFGSALLQAAERDVMDLGGMGLIAWGMSIPVFMRASWFKKHGYKRIDRIGIQELLWKPFFGNACPPKWVRPKKTPAAVKDKVSVVCFKTGWCPAQNIVYERAKRAVCEFPSEVVFNAVDTLDERTRREWGISDALYIDGKQIRTGPPPSYEKITSLIRKRLKRLKR